MEVDYKQKNIEAVEKMLAGTQYKTLAEYFAAKNYADAIRTFRNFGGGCVVCGDYISSRTLDDFFNFDYKRVKCYICQYKN